MRLLAITNEFPLPLDRGGPVRFFGLARALAEAHDVHMLALRRPSTTAVLIDELARVLGGPVEVFDWPESSGGWPQALRSGVPPWVRAQHSHELERRAHELAGHMDAVVVLDDYAAIYTPGLATHVPVVCDKSNVLGWSAGDTQAAGGVKSRTHQRLSISLTRRFERAHLADAASLVVTSKDEADRLRALYGLDADAVVPSAVDLPPTSVRPGGTAAIGWLGTHEYEPNVEGLVRFVEEGWASLGSAGLRLLVAGGSPPAHVRDLGSQVGVEILGFVESLETLFAELSAAVVPLWSGAGVKLKTLTFMAAGIPVAGTPAAVEGIDGEPGRHYLVAEDPGGLATAARQLIDDPAGARRIGAEGRALVARDYSWPVVGAHFREEVERIVAETADRQVV